MKEAKIKCVFQSKKLKKRCLEMIKGLWKIQVLISWALTMHNIHMYEDSITLLVGRFCKPEKQSWLESLVLPKAGYLNKTPHTSVFSM